MTKTFNTPNAQDGLLLKGIVYPAPGETRAVLNIVHGFGEHGARYTDLALHLNTHGIAVVTLDLRGHGRSGGKRGVSKKYETLLGDIDALLVKSKSLYPDVPHLMMGHSMGGGLVLNHVLKRGLGDLKGVISQAPLLHPYEPLPGAQMFVLKILRHILPNFTADSGLDSGAISTIDAEVKKYEADPLVHGMMGAGLAVDVMRQGEWALENAKSWTAPLLLLHARQDKLTKFEASEDFAARAKNCEFHAFDDAYHEIHNDVCRDDVYKLITTFIESRI